MPKPFCYDVPADYSISGSRHVFGVSCEVHAGHRVASVLIAVLQYGHIRTGCGSGSCFLVSDMSLFMPFIIKNTITAIIRKLIRFVINAPYIMVAPNTLRTSLSKLLPTNIPSIGDKILLVKDATTLCNAPPMIMPIASAMMLLFKANSLNSVNVFFIFGALHFHRIAILSLYSMALLFQLRPAMIITSKGHL